MPKLKATGASGTSLEASPASLEPTPAYRHYVLILLLVVYVVNFIDRQILGILIEPIKQDLGVSDTQMGLLTGLAFALFYTAAGIPIARLADQFSRRSLLAAGVGLWSVMTAVSGLAASFRQLLMARIGVGVGEATCVPAAHSLISDYFPARRRATALAVFSMGAHGGVMVGLVMGGWVNEWLGWRWALGAAGLPGILLALVVRLTIREPLRGRLDGFVEERTQSFPEVLRHLWSSKSFRHLAFASGLASLTGYGLIVWSPVFFIRVHGMSTGETGTWLGVLAGLGGVAGTLCGGVLADRLSVRDRRWWLWLPAASQLLTVPALMFFLFFETSSKALAAITACYVLSALWMGPTYAVTQGIASPRMRAMAAALLLLLINLIGLGLGPLVVGLLNDVLASGLGLLAIRYSLATLTIASLWASLHYFWGAFSLRSDLQKSTDL